MLMITDSEDWLVFILPEENKTRSNIIFYGCVLIEFVRLSVSTNSLSGVS